MAGDTIKLYNLVLDVQKVSQTLKHEIALLSRAGVGGGATQVFPTSGHFGILSTPKKEGTPTTSSPATYRSKAAGDATTQSVTHRHMTHRHMTHFDTTLAAGLRGLEMERFSERYAGRVAGRDASGPFDCLNDCELTELETGVGVGAGGVYVCMYILDMHVD